MYRAGWGRKDERQRRILAIDITREGFEWALGHATLTNVAAVSLDGEPEFEARNPGGGRRVQWDPERTLLSQPLAVGVFRSGFGARPYSNMFRIGRVRLQTSLSWRKRSRAMWKAVILK